VNSPDDFGSKGVIPPLKITAEACCVTRTPSGAIQCLDWVCILGRTFRQTYTPALKTMTLELYHGQVLHLDQEQTRHLIEYLGIIARGDSGEWIHSRRSPRPFLDIVEPLLEDTAPTDRVVGNHKYPSWSLLWPHDEATAPTEDKA
jgi:hypothetical protein